MQGLMVIFIVGLMVGAFALSRSYYKQNPKIARKVDAETNNQPWWM